MLFQQPPGQPIRLLARLMLPLVKAHQPAAPVAAKHRVECFVRLGMKLDPQLLDRPARQIG
jgi:hypothetical protein